MSIHLTPKSGGDPEPHSGGESADAQRALQQTASYAADKKRQQEEALRYSVESNTTGTQAGIIDPKKFPKHKQKCN